MSYHTFLIKISNTKYVFVVNLCFQSSWDFIIKIQLEKIIYQNLNRKLKQNKARVTISI